jgi:hypothetical protein
VIFLTGECLKARAGEVGPWAPSPDGEQRILGPASPKRNGAYVAEMSCSITVVIVYGYDRIRMTVIVPAGGHSLFSSDLSDAVLAYKLKR